MESRIEELLEKYWNGESTLAEEEALREFYSKNPSLTPTGLFFRTLKKSTEVTSERPFNKPRKQWISTKYSVAATIILGVIVGGIALQDGGKQDEFEIEDPQEAYEIARQALLKMSSSLNQGQTYSVELKKINKAEEIIKNEKL